LLLGSASAGIFFAFSAFEVKTESHPEINSKAENAKKIPAEAEPSSKKEHKALAILENAVKLEKEKISKEEK
jgi:hypothetical protein